MYSNYASNASNPGEIGSEIPPRYQVASLAQYRQNSGSLNAKTSYPAFENADTILTPQPVTRSNTISGTASNFGAQRPDSGVDRFGQRPGSSGGISASGDGEDIKAKLARYKREREELEQVRLQLRAKNQSAVARSSPAA